MTEATIIRDGAEMVRQMRPERIAGRFVFRALAADDIARHMPNIRGLFVEEEGVSAILPAQAGDTDAMAQITLQVHSALDGVGLTAAVSGALADADIPCNMVAALRHDHVFVPEADAEAALTILRALSGRPETKG